MRQETVHSADTRPSGLNAHLSLSSNSGTRGFTLLELIIVLLLISFIISLSIPFFARSLASSKFDETVRHLTAAIRHARTLSQVNNEVQVVYIDLDSKKYGIEGQGSRDLPPDIDIKVLDPMAGEIYKGIYPVVFSPFSGFGGGTIVLWNKKKKVSIETDPVAGAVAIK